MDDEAQIRLVVAHAQGRGGHQSFALVGDQGIFQSLTIAVVHCAGISAGIDAAGLQPFGHQRGITGGEGVDDAATLQVRQRLGQPGEACRLAGEAEALEGEGRAVEIAPLQTEFRAEFAFQVGYHPVASGRCGRQQAHVWQGLYQPANAAVVGAEVVAPVRDAVSLIDHHQAGVELGERTSYEFRCVQPLGRDQQDVDLSPAHLLLHRLPLVGVGGIDRACAQSHPLRGSNLVAHQRQQRRNQQGWSAAGVSQKLGGNEVDETLAPAGLLHHQQATSLFADCLDGFLLPIAKMC